MVTYTVTVFTGSIASATAFNKIYIKLVGTDGESGRKRLSSFKGPASFWRGAVSTFRLRCRPMGKLTRIELVKKRYLLFPEIPWFVDKLEIRSPGGEIYKFPIYRWISDNCVHQFREGTALRAADDNDRSNLSREQELKKRQQDYRWCVYAEGLPHCMEAESPCSLPCEVQFSFTKAMEFAFTAAAGMVELKLEGLENCNENWTNIDDIKGVFRCHRTDISDYSQEHWKEDAFFGYQYLNGLDPMLIELCTALPDNFPVTDCMVFPDGKTTLAKEMENGNIFLLDYKNLDGIQANVIDGKQQYLMAPLVLLHQTPENKLMPVAIQLKQCPADDNPIFLPTDDEYDWLLAKIFVRSADFNEHELNYHLLRTHLLAEVFTVSLLRNVPMVHPLYKLLIPHTRYSLQINFLARRLLISPTGVFTKFTSSGGDGMMTILKRSLSSMTYSSLCIKESIANRGLEKVPNFYYRDDGIKLWDIIQKFVNGLLSHYYRTDAEVVRDPELQKWIQDIYEHGFLSQECTGIPQRFTTMAEMVKFVTMVIFTCSCQHSAVNNGQYDLGGWMPNTPISLQRPPPTTKGTASEELMLKTLPTHSVTAHGMATLWLLSKQSSDFVPLGQYPEERFTEEFPQRMIKDFQGELEALSTAINTRNKCLEVPYTYLDPKEVENSVAI